MKLYLVVIQDKDLPGEPDIGMTIIEGNQLAADNARDQMERECAKAGRARCVGRVREVERGKHYKARAMIRTSSDPTSPRRMKGRR